VKIIVDNYKNASAYFPANGLYLGSTKYMFIRGGGDDPIHFKKGSETGGTIQITSKAIVIGKYDEPSAAGNVSDRISVMGTYLVSVGY